MRSSQIEEGRGYIAVDEIRLSNRSSTSAPPVGSDSDQLPGVTEPVLELAGVIKALHTTAHDAAADRLAAAVEQARAIEQQIPEPTLALAIADGTGQDERIHIRGSHKNLGEIVPRRFLEILGGSDSATGEGSGRLDLARRMVDPRLNPLLPRVLVNRLWKHHFGEGIVKSTDDFGAMGQQPSHPELLDWLVSELLAHDWSWKALHRLMVTSSTYRMVSTPHGDLERLDPTNTFLHRMNVRRLEAEAIRDALLAVSGRLVPSMYGKSTPVHLTSFMEGRGRPASVRSARRRRPEKPLFERSAQFPQSDVPGFRHAGSVLDHGPAQRVECPGPGAHAHERPPGGRPGSPLGRAHCDRTQPIGPRAARQPLRDRLFPASHFRGGQSMPGVSRPPNASRARRTGVRYERQVLAWTDLCHVLVNMKEFIFID